MDKSKAGPTKSPSVRRCISGTSLNFGTPSAGAKKLRKLLTPKTKSKSALDKILFKTELTFPSENFAEVNNVTKIEKRSKINEKVDKTKTKKVSKVKTWLCEKNLLDDNSNSSVAAKKVTGTIPKSKKEAATKNVPEPLIKQLPEKVDSNEAEVSEDLNRSNDEKENIPPEELSALSADVSGIGDDFEESGIDVKDVDVDEDNDQEIDEYTELEEVIKEKLENKPKKIKAPLRKTAEEMKLQKKLDKRAKKDKRFAKVLSELSDQVARHLNGAGFSSEDDSSCDCESDSSVSSYKSSCSCEECGSSSFYSSKSSYSSSTEAYPDSDISDCCDNCKGRRLYY